MDNGKITIQDNVKKELVKFKHRIIRLEMKKGDIPFRDYHHSLNIIYDQVIEDIHQHYKHAKIVQRRKRG